MARRRRRRRGRASRIPREVRASLPFLRRRSTRWLFAAVATLIIGVLLGVIAGTRGDDGGEPTPVPTLAVALPDIEPEPEALQRAQVVAVIDGDTIDVRIDGRDERVRYYGVDTPERGDRCYDEARERNEALAGLSVLLLPDARERDPFDRLLRYVFDTAGASIDARLIAEGLAVAWREDGVYRDELVALEEDVRTAQAGCLWSG